MPQFPVQIKRSGTASSAPTSLLHGELAINYNVADGKLFWKDSSNTIRSFAFASYLPTSGGTISGSLTVNGDLTVLGDTVTLTTSTVVVEDKNIELGSVYSPTDETADGGGITLLASSPKSIIWYNATDSWTFNQNVELTSGFSYRINGASVLNATTLGSGVTSSSLTSVGTVTTGVWSATAIGPTKGGTGLTSVPQGSVLVANAANTITALDGGGAADAFLTYTASTDSVGWSTTFPSSSLPLATTSTAGVVIVGTGLSVSSGTVSVAYGSNSTSACRGDDSRLSDSRAPSGAAGGDLTGTYPNPQIAAGAIVTADLANSAVTYAKIQNVSATDRLLGRSSAGAGVIEEVTCTSFARSILDDASAADVRATIAVQPTASPAFTGTASVYNTAGDGRFTVQGLQTASGGTGKAALQIDVNGQGGFAWQCDTTSGKTLRLINNNGYGAGESTLLTVTSAGVLAVGGNTVLNAGNYNSYSPTLTGGGASGTWGINVSGELTGTQVGLGYTLSTATVAYGGQAGPQIRGQGGGAAAISFHRPNAYAVNFGLDTDNQLKVGGWSLGANSYVILSSGNYNSYSPTLTGGGASGTWSINVTGSAGSAGSATYASYQSATGTANVWNTNFSETPAHTRNFREMSGGGPQGAWWFVENMRHSNASNFWGRQNAWGWEDNANEFWSRNITANSYGAWVRFIHSGNYNSYAPTLTGGGASGTWGINVTGTAASETLATVTGRGASTSTNITTTGAMFASNWYRSYGATGWYNESYGGGIWMSDATYVRVYNGKQFYADAAISSGTAIYAPIFYDNNDASWYCDPNGTSRLNAVQAQEVLVLGENLYVGNAVNASYIRMRDADEGERIIHCNSNRIGFLTQAGGWGAWCNDDGSWESVGRVTATEFYESGFAGRIFGAKAWCIHFGNTSPTLLANSSGNVSSITYRNTGRYRVNFTTGILPTGAVMLGTAYDVVSPGDSASATMVRIGQRYISSSRLTGIDYAVSVGGAYSGALDVALIVVG